MGSSLANDDESDTVDLGELTNSPGFLFRLAQVKVFESFYDKMSKLDLTAGEFTVLWVIGLNPGMRQGIIARKLSIKPAHMTRLIQRMVNANYVDRVTPPDDRRSIRLSLTPQAKKLIAKNKAEFIRLHHSERDNLSTTELAQLIKLLRKYTRLE